MALTLGDGREGHCTVTLERRVLFSGEEKRHINHPKTSVLSAALEFCQSSPDFPSIAAQKNGEKKRTGGKSQKLSSLCHGQTE